MEDNKNKKIICYVFHTYCGPVPTGCELDTYAYIKNLPDVCKQNIKIFSSDEKEREYIKDLFKENNFELVADHYVSKQRTGMYIVDWTKFNPFVDDYDSFIKRAGENIKIITKDVKVYDRLVFDWLGSEDNFIDTMGGIIIRDYSINMDILNFGWKVEKKGMTSSHSISDIILGTHIKKGENVVNFFIDLFESGKAYAIKYINKKNVVAWNKNFLPSECNNSPKNFFLNFSQAQNTSPLGGIGQRPLERSDIACAQTPTGNIFIVYKITKNLKDVIYPDRRVS